VADGDRVLEVGQIIDQTLRRRHQGSRDFELVVPRELLAQRVEVQRTFNVVVGSVAVLSLLVGGIGIMNIMLVTVTERTREIGIRKALGATKGNILLQFLVESMTLCLIGGLLGLAVGAGAAMFAANSAGWQTVVTSTSVFPAFIFSAAVGLFFGIMPARRAAGLDPIDALRYE